MDGARAVEARTVLLSQHGAPTTVAAAAAAEEGANGQVVQRWRSGSGLPLVTAYRKCQGYAVRNIDRFLLANMALPDPIPREGMGRVRRMRVRAVAGGLVSFVALMVQMHCLTHGWNHFWAGLPEACGGLGAWLTSYCMVLTMLPFCQVFGAPLVAAWACYGRFLRGRLEDPGACLAGAPGMYHFVDEVLRDALVTCGLLVFSMSLLGFAKRQIVELRRVYGTTGPANEEVVRRILEDATPVPPEAECSICLEGAEAAERGEVVEQQRWRRLRCGHAFHQQCLLEWLGRARRCPLCRQDLHETYLLGERSDQVAEELATANRGQAQAQGQVRATAADASQAAPL